MDDDVLEPKDLDEETTEDDVEDLSALGKKKPKKDLDEDSLDTLAEEEDEVLPEDAFDDQDLW